MESGGGDRARSARKTRLHSNQANQRQRRRSTRSNSTATSNRFTLWPKAQTRRDRRTNPQIPGPSLSVSPTQPRSLESSGYRSADQNTYGSDTELKIKNPWEPLPRTISDSRKILSIQDKYPTSNSRYATNAPLRFPQEGTAHSRRRSRTGRPSLAMPFVGSTPPAERRHSSKRVASRSSGSPLLYGLRLLILGIGVGVIAGTFLSVWDPASRLNAEVSRTENGAKSVAEQGTTSQQAATPTAPRLGQEIAALKTEIQSLSAQTTGLSPGIFLIDLDTSSYVDINGTIPVAAASTIKVPVLVAFFQDVDAGKIRLDEMLTMQPEMVATGSGDMQYQSPGTKYSALETATKMIAISDNTATNMLITRMGGAVALNQRFQSWGLTATVIQNPLPDLQGTNTTSPKDLANLLAWVNQGDLVSMRSRDRILDIMRQTVTNTMLPSGLGEGAIIAHKTGNIDSLAGDVGLIDMPSGKRYIVSALVKRSPNNEQAPELIRQVSERAYKYFSRPTPTNGPTPTSSPSPTGQNSEVSSPTPSNSINSPNPGRPSSPLRNAPASPR